MPRHIFSDGINSLAHFTLGYISVQTPIVIPVFLLYQWMEYKHLNDDITVDVSEFIIGYLIGKSYK